MARMGPLKEFATLVDVRQTFLWRAWLVWVSVAIVAALSQILADAVVSGADALSDGALKPQWPFSEVTLIHPMIP